MNLSNIFNRLLPKSWRGKTRIDYDFSMEEDQYSIVLTNDLSRTWWLQLIRKFNEQSKEKIELLDEFEVTNERLKEQFKTHLKPTLKKIVKDIRKDEPMKNMKLLNCNVDRIWFKQVDEKTVKSEISLSGLCSV